MKACDEQFTFAIPIIFFQSIYFRDVSLKNYLLFDFLCKPKQINVRILHSVEFNLNASLTQLYQDFPLVQTSKLPAFICALLPYWQRYVLLAVQNEVTIALNIFFQHCDFDGLKPSTTALVVISPYGTMHDHACFPSYTRLAFSLS